MKYLASIFGAIGLLWSAFLGHPVASQPVQTFGATVNTLPTIVANYQDSLAVAEGTSDTSFTLVSGQDSLARSLSGFYCFTVDPNTSIAEYECGTASSTSVTGVTRGVDPVNPNATSSVLIFAHRRGAAVVISDYTPIASINRMLQGIDTLPSGTVLQYNPNVTNAYVLGSPNNLVDESALASTSFSGTVNGSPIQKGIYQEATTSTIASGTTVGTTGADLTLTQNTASTSASPYSVVETNASGTLDPSFVSSTRTYAFNSLTSASTTLNGTTTASGTILLNGTSIGASLDKFGGNGASGTLSLTSGTTTLNLGSASVFERDYTSISITATGSLAFSNPNTNGTVIILKSQGNVVINTSSSPAIDISSLGGVGGSAISSNSGVGVGGNSGSTFGYFTTPGLTAGSGGSGTSPNGGGGAGTVQSVLTTSTIPFIRIPVMPSGGAGSGSCYSSANNGLFSGAGGTSGGAIYIEVGGTLTLNGVLKGVGSNGGAGTGNYCSGGGAGAGGMYVFLYNTLATNTATFNLSPGSVGAAGGGQGNAGNSAATGTAYVLQNTVW